jgi:hypothetical protein
VYSYAAELIDEMISNMRPAELANRPVLRARLAAMIREADRRITPDDDDETVCLDAALPAFGGPSIDDSALLAPGGVS